MDWFRFVFYTAGIFYKEPGFGFTLNT